MTLFFKPFNAIKKTSNIIFFAFRKIFSKKISPSRLYYILTIIFPAFVFNIGRYFLLVKITSCYQFKKLITVYPEFIYKFVYNYLLISLNPSSRLKIIINHYEYVLKFLHKEFINNLVDNPINLWNTSIDHHEFAITLSFPFSPNDIYYHYDNEGEVQISLFMNSIKVQTFCFTIISNFKDIKLLGINKNPGVLIARVQGIKDGVSVYHGATKLMHDISPPHLILAAVKGIADALSLNLIYGVSNEQHIFGANELLFNYNKFWSGVGASLQDGGIFSVSTNLPDKSIALIKQNHRSRTLKKREFKENVRKVCAESFRTQCMLGGSEVNG